LVTHRHFEVNGRLTNVPSFQVKPGDVVKVRKSTSPAATSAEDAKIRAVPAWLAFNPSEVSGKVLALPSREEMEMGVEEHLIVEFYSR
jgi:small subunit ribosomal protein S4